MLVGLLMLLVPIVVFMVTLPFLRWMKPPLRMLYLIVGGIVVFVGSGISIYLAAYTGDQGGVGAYFLQVTVISVYLVFSISLFILNGLLHRRDSRK